MLQPSQPLDVNDPIAVAQRYEQLRRDVWAGRDTRFRGKHGERRDLLAADLDVGLKGASLDRVALLLHLPLAVQSAISRRRITQSLGHAILRLPPLTQEAIAADLDAGAKKADLESKYNLGPRQKKTSELRLLSSLTLLFRRLPLEPERLDVRILEDRSRISLARMVDTIVKILNELRARMAGDAKATRLRNQTKGNGRKVSKRSAKR